MSVKIDDFQPWLQNLVDRYITLNDAERNLVIDCLLAHSGPSQLYHLQKKAKCLLHRDFLKLLPAELREHVLSFLGGQSLLKSCLVSKTWNNVINSSAMVWQAACRHSGFIVDKDFNTTDTNYWKSFYIEMAKRRSDMMLYKAFVQKTYDRNLRRVTAVHYYDGKIATASDSKIIQIWDCDEDICIMTIRTDSSIASVKFDDQIIIASSYLGHLVSWDFNTGQRLVEYMRHSGAIFTFDYSRDLNIVVSGAADFKVKIWSLQWGYLCKTLAEHSRWVVKVMLSSYDTPTDSKGQAKHLLFSMDRAVINIRMVSSLNFPTDTIYLTFLFSINVEHSDILFSPDIHFDGEYLYFVENHSKTSILHKWDVRQNKAVSETDLKMKIKLLVGVGKKYFAVLKPFQHNTMPNFMVMDKETEEMVAVWKIPPVKNQNLDQGNSHVLLGNKYWLDGLDGENDQGVVLVIAQDDNCAGVLKWVERPEFIS